MSWGAGNSGGDWGAGDGAVVASEWNDGGNPGTDFGGGATSGGFGGDADFGGGNNDFSNSGNDFGSREAGGEAGGEGDDRACYNCGEPGHNKADCPNPRTFTGECRICKKEGHMSKDCPDAGPPRCGNCRREGHYIDDCPEPLICPRCAGCHRVRDCTEPLKCRHCEGEHFAKECPTYVATCKNCGEPGHIISECKNARKIDRSHLPDMTGEEAWKKLEAAIRERDMDDVKEMIQTYVKSQAGTTFVDIESALRAQGYGLYLIPLVKENISITLTNMDLQGNLGKKYTVNYRFSDKPRRQTEREGWPKDHEEVMARLADAGDVVPLGIPKCSNCNELGHISKNCEQEKVEAERVVVKCYNCDQEGHRVRDCPVPRVDKFACKNCGKGGHKVAECPEPPNLDNVQCRKCEKMGHFSRDCPDAPSRACRNCGGEGHMAKECTEPRNMANVQCRNCDEYGHTGKDCPKPRDMSRVQCQNCQEMGHFKSKCPNPHVPEDVGGDNGGDAGAADNWGADNATAAAGVDSGSAW